MRLFIFMGLLSIAESIGSQTGWNPHDGIVAILLVVTIAAVMDIVEFIKNTIK